MKPRDKMTWENYPEFQKKWYKLQLLDTFTEVPNNQYDKTNTKVWWVLTTTQKNTIGKTFNRKVKHTTNIVKNDILKIIRLRDSLNCKRKLYKTKVEELLKTQSKKVSLWFEYFLWDSIERELIKEKNDDLIFEKPWYHIDQNYSTDLICTYQNNKWEKEVIWIDLTFSSDDNILNKKKNKIKKVNHDLKKWLTDYSWKRTPDKTSILIINNQTLNIWNGSLINALDHFYELNNKKWWPWKYLYEWENDRINNFSEILISIFNKIKNGEFQSYNLWENNIEIKQEWNNMIFKVSKDNKNIFEYILEIEK